MIIAVRAQHARISRSTDTDPADSRLAMTMTIQRQSSCHPATMRLESESESGHMNARSIIGAGRLQIRARGVYYGWWIVAASAGIQMLQAGLMQQAYGAYVSVLRANFGWSATALAVGYSLQPVQNELLGPVQGWMIDRWGPRPVMRVGMLLFGGAFLAFSQVNSLLAFYIVLVLIALGSSLAGFM
jgi:MFS family permease